MTGWLTAIEFLRARRPPRKNALMYFALGAAGALGALIMALILIHARTPRQQGRPVSYWIEELTGDEPEKAQAALLAMGERAIPYLLDAVKTETSPAPAQFLEKITGFPLVGRLAEKLAERRYRREQIPDAAAEVLVKLPQHAKRFVPELARAYQDPKQPEDVIGRAAEVLADLGPQASWAMPSYLAHLRGAHLPNKYLTVSILSAIGPPAKESVPWLTNLFNGEGANDLIVAGALWTIDRRTNETLRACLRILQVPHRRVNEGLIRQSLELLARMGPAAREATAVVRDLLLTGDGARLPAEMTLRSIDPSALSEAYAEANTMARQWVEQTVDSLGKQGVWAPTPQRTNFFRALPAIAALGPEAKAAVPRLVELLASTPPVGLDSPENSFRVRILTHAAQALGQIGEASEAVVSALAGQLQSNPSLAQACGEALGRLGPSARAAVPALRQMLEVKYSSLPRGTASTRLSREIDDSTVRLNAAMALVNLAPDAASDVVPALRELELLQDVRVRTAARLARWKIERSGPPPIEQLLSAPITDLFLDKMKLLGWLGPEAEAVLPDLIGVVVSNSLPGLRLRAADAIRRIDPAIYEQLQLPGPLALPDNPHE